ncbi:subunit beta of geranylgeranyl transferase type-2 [Hamiltosporidium tvaerminnensis]|uniref:Geranylgeranyl transferase type-2 subunit beta n=2 Tax=Hamiltosporidium TaxID=1176354 RepID=A0A4Q9LMB2_9MICR|nr:subunit beta of geranylgeranyl transferase type-2 [Hamiltosporidium magnivora]TBU00568.1 subunit beta of geranylgeranyl transferase type-2 [Hamiltosporidium tvaerminnensis]TBU08340.1 subunit beta of geranylgeranyl transferase type-2 [Hamiltosporidium magnivora]TBU13596.1 subunit beta of geranylgeranyl transferase type-2 [Hamiltosporidium tvaerminnensis]TBU13622.1 subunit beta of geranylgeranyl transferase type-2 [Hamiltosporidium tvaerminnensis]
MTILKEKHIEFLTKETQTRNFLYFSTKPLRLATIYWTVCALKMLKKTDILKEKRNEIISYILSCQNTDKGFGASKDFPSTILSTFNALQIFYILEYLYFDKKTIKYILSNFDSSDGSFKNDTGGEKDTRFSCCAILSLHLLFLFNKYGKFVFKKKLNQPIDYKYIKYLEGKGFNVEKFVQNILNCCNPDGGIGSKPGSESHAAQIFCCISSLRSLNLIDIIDLEKVKKFLIFRQTENGGLNGRPNKKEDVCYSFWVFSSLVMINSDDKIDKNSLKEFILTCQSEEGGFSDRKGHEPDIYHTMFALAGLYLLGNTDLESIDPGFCL